MYMNMFIYFIIYLKHLLGRSTECVRTATATCFQFGYQRIDIKMQTSDTTARIRLYGIFSTIWFGLFTRPKVVRILYAVTTAAVTFWFLHEKHRVHVPFTYMLYNNSNVKQTSLKYNK